jgi:hypothetical protein
MRPTQNTTPKVAKTISIRSLLVCLVEPICIVARLRERAQRFLQLFWYNLLFFLLFHLLWPRTANPIVQGWGEMVGSDFFGGGKDCLALYASGFHFTDPD